MFEVELIGWTAPKREVWEMGAGEVLDEAARLKASGGQAVGSISAVSRLHLGCISAVSRLYLGCVSAVSRLHLGLPPALPHLTSPHLTSPRLASRRSARKITAVRWQRTGLRRGCCWTRREIPPRFRRDSPRFAEIRRDSPRFAEIRRDSPHRAAARLLPDDAPAEGHAWVSWASWGGTVRHAGLSAWCDIRVTGHDTRHQSDGA